MNTGPIPLPDLLARYNESVPNGAERVLRVLESEVAHRHAMETKLIDSHVGAARRGFVAAIMVVIATLSIGTWCLYTGRSTAGLAILLVPTAILAGTFFGQLKRNRTASRAVEGKP